MYSQYSGTLTCQISPKSALVREKCSETNPNFDSEIFATSKKFSFRRYFVPLTFTLINASEFLTNYKTVNAKSHSRSFLQGLFNKSSKNGEIEMIP